MNAFKKLALTLMFAGVVLVPAANAQATTSLDDMLKQIQTLMAQIEELQKQLNTVRGEIKSVIRDGIAEGMEGEDIKKLQELLATDPTIYPEGKMTGYFGPLTKEAIKRFQARHELEVTGTIDEETHEWLEEYFGEMYGDKIPPGLLRAPGIAKKVELRLELKCEGKDSKHGMGPLCKKFEYKYKWKDDDSDDDDDDSDDDSSDDGYDVEVEIEDGETTVTFMWDGEEKTVTVDSTLQADVLSAVADELDTEVDGLDSDLKLEIKKELEKALDDEADAEDKADAEDAIADAEDAIADAEDAIDEATDDEDKADAQELLDDANDTLDDAQAAFDDGNYDEAEDLAKDAEDLAKDAEDTAEGNA